MSELTEENPANPDAPDSSKEGAILVTLMRIYDLLAIQIKENHPAYANILALHAAGRVLGPMPFLVGEEEPDEELQHPAFSVDQDIPRWE